MKLYICEDIRTAKWRKNITEIEDKLLSLAFVKKCICDFIGEKERVINIVFSKNQYGKPSVESIYKINPQNKSIKIKIDISLFFSLSHSENMMICAVACFNIGADCQKRNIENIDSCKKIADRFYSKKENIFLDSLLDSSNPEKSDKDIKNKEQTYINNFFRIWTKKEAYIKYTGKGLSEGLKNFSVTSETRQKSYHGNVYLKKIPLVNSKKFGNNKFYVYLCYNKENKNTWQVKYL